MLRKYLSQKSKSQNKKGRPCIRTAGVSFFVIIPTLLFLYQIQPSEWSVMRHCDMQHQELKREAVSFLILREYAVNPENKKDRCTRLSGLEDGDVLVTDATYCLGWRHGHVGLVVDATRGETLEAYSVGTVSDFNRVSAWEYYPRVLVLRLKASREQRKEIAAYAKEKLVGLPYRLAAGAVDDKDMKGEYWGTQCAHLVWLAFHQYGYDVDSDGGWLVTPKDIADSDCFDRIETEAY